MHNEAPVQLSPIHAKTPLNFLSDAYDTPGELQCKTRSMAPIPRQIQYKRTALFQARDSLYGGWTRSRDP